VLVSGPTRLQVPEEDGGILAVPPLSEVGALLSIAGDQLRRAGALLMGGSLSEWRRLARSEVLAAACSYLADAGEPVPHLDGELILMAGHQPELFHPGVWLKNFALYQLAGAHRAIPLNLVVDNDAVKATSLRVPAVKLPLPPIGTFRPHTIAVPIDRVHPGLPSEEWTVRDEAFFSSLPERVREATVGPAVPDALECPAQPDLLEPFWEEVRRQGRRTKNVPERLAAARRTFERSWGCHNLEVPVSVVSRTDAFAWFATCILAGLPRFHQVFNEAVRAYRKAHGLKSRNHPFPDLIHDGDWYEAPFWVWRRGSPKRSRLFVRHLAASLVLRLGDEPGPILSRAHLVETWLSLEMEEIKVRPRALTNTLFARLLVADLFVHGIGGGRYDEVTDEVMARYFEVEPPPFLVVSGTLRLPLPAYPASRDDVRRLERLKRDLEFNPQRHLAEDQRTRELLSQRREWVAREVSDAAGARARWRAIRRLNELLGALLEEQRQELERELRRSRAEVAANAVLRRRDWAFCLYPERVLREFCTQELSLDTPRTNPS
jgi:hypothetical protein